MEHAGAATRCAVEDTYSPHSIHADWRSDFALFRITTPAPIARIVKGRDFRRKPGDTFFIQSKYPGRINSEIARVAGSAHTLPEIVFASLVDLDPDPHLRPIGPACVVPLGADHIAGTSKAFVAGSFGIVSSMASVVQ